MPTIIPKLQHPSVPSFSFSSVFRRRPQRERLLLICVNPPISVVVLLDFISRRAAEPQRLVWSLDVRSLDGRRDKIAFSCVGELSHSNRITRFCMMCRIVLGCAQHKHPEHPDKS